MASFLAIDFETANPRRDSPCSLGVVRVDDGAVSHEWSTLIDPEAEFAPMNMNIHGITPDDVEGAPTFLEVAQQLVDMTDGTECLVAHNAAFDISVLRRSLERYRAEIRGVRFACTQVFSRRWFPTWPTYSLGYVVHQLDLYDECGEGSHHEALWDARACAAVARAGFVAAGVASWEEAAKGAGVALGELHIGRYKGCRGQGQGGLEPTYPSEVDVDPEHPLYQVTVCFTGTLAHLSRQEAAQLVADKGGTFAKTVTRETDLLVVGQQDLDRLAGHTESAKMRKAADMAADGHPIEIIGEDDFAELLSS